MLYNFYSIVKLNVKAFGERIRCKKYSLHDYNNLLSVACALIRNYNYITANYCFAYIIYSPAIVSLMSGNWRRITIGYYNTRFAKWDFFIYVNMWIRIKWIFSAKLFSLISHLMDSIALFEVVNNPFGRRVCLLEA